MGVTPDVFSGTGTLIWDCNTSPPLPNLTHGATGNLTFNNGTLTTTFTIINNGTADAGPSFVCPYLSVNQANNQNISLGGGIPIPAIPAGSSYTVSNQSFNFCSSSSPISVGTYYFGFEVDCTNAVMESNESYDDNTGFFPGNPINHMGCGSVTISPPTQTINALGGCVTYTLTANTSWTVSVSPAWASVQPPTSGVAGTYPIQVCATANTSQSQRTATIIATAGNASASATLIQSGATLTVSPANISLPANSGSTSFSITSTCSNWTITGIPSWMTVDPTSGSGNSPVNIQYQANTSPTPRTATLTVSGCSFNRSVTITQGGGATNTLTVSPTTLNVGAGAGETNFSIVSNCPNWTITGIPAWMTVIPASGSGNAPVTIQYQANTSTMPRTATLTVSGCFLSQNVTITQAGAPGSITFTIASASNVMNGQQVCLNVTAQNFTNIMGMQFSMNYNPAMLQYVSVSNFNLQGLTANSFGVPGSGGTNPGTITLSWTDPDLGGETLANGATVFQLCFTALTGSGSTTVTFGNTPTAIEFINSQSQTVVFNSVPGTVSFSGGAPTFTLTASPATLNVGANADSTNFSITSNCSNWIITNIPAWMTVSPTSGSGNSPVNIQYQANTSPTPRTATLIVSGCSLSQNVTITQAGATNTLSVSPATLNVGANADSTNFSITSNCSNWTITNIPAWMTVSPISGSGNITVDIQYQQNTSTASRTATLIVSGCSLSQNVIVNQAGATITYPWIPSSPNPNNHSIILPATLDAAIDGVSIEVGDLIGFFYEHDDVLYCSNFAVWAGTSTGIPIYGNDLPPGMGKNGFDEGELIIVKIFRVATSEEFTATAVQYAPVVNPITHTDRFATDGISMITRISATSVDTLHIHLDAGWNTISSYVMPSEPGMIPVFSDIFHSVVLVKDGDGLFVFPPDINLIGNWTITKGYQVRAADPVTLTVIGRRADPTATPINLQEGWQIISYLRNEPASAVEELSSVASHIDIVKNNAGEIYYPELGVNTIGNLLPTQGYKLKANSNALLYYTPNTVNFTGTPSISMSASASVTEPVNFVLGGLNTGNNSTLIFPAAANAFFEDGDEIGVFTPQGILCGAASAGTQSFAVTIWGDDPSTPDIREGLSPNEPFAVRVWRASTGQEMELHLVFQRGSDRYQEDDIAVVAGWNVLSSVSSQILHRQTLSAWPNPNNGRFWVNAPEFLNWIQVYDAQGRLVYRATDLHAGQIEIDLPDASGGMLFLQAWGQSGRCTGAVSVVR
ncbi:MAG: hypothetical protein KF852_04725 [Saprospiraceae bacterium]|nr:hypothetical protein [Saprospiraceae bacterium]